MEGRRTRRREQGQISLPSTPPWLQDDVRYAPRVACLERATTIQSAGALRTPWRDGGHGDENKAKSPCPPHLHGCKTASGMHLALRACIVPRQSRASEHSEHHGGTEDAETRTKLNLPALHTSTVARQRPVRASRRVAGSCHGNPERRGTPNTMEARRTRRRAQGQISLPSSPPWLQDRVRYAPGARHGNPDRPGALRTPWRYGEHGDENKAKSPCSPHLHGCKAASDAVSEPRRSAPRARGPRMPRPVRARPVPPRSARRERDLLSARA